MEELARCAACARTPLIGEGVTVLGAGRRESPVCDLCREKPRAQALGEPLRRERIRSAEGAANVRIVPAPAPVPTRTAPAPPVVAT